MSGDDGHRFALFRSYLFIATGTLSPLGADALAAVVRKCTQLERLILLGADKVLHSSFDLVDALASLPALRHLEYAASSDFASKHCAVFFERLHGGLLTARLRLPGPARGIFVSRVGSDITDPTTLLRNSASTLTELSGTGFHIREKQPSTIYPHVKRLAIGVAMLPMLGPYMVAFPNVTSLELIGMSVLDAPITLHYYSNESAMWLAELETSHPLWTVLEDVTGELAHVFVAHVRCKVKRLHLHSRVKHLGEHLQYLPDLLTRTTPTVLHLEAELAAFGTEAEDALRVGWAFGRTEASRGIRVLELRIFIQGEECKLSPESLLERVLPSVRPLESLENLQVVFEVTHWRNVSSLGGLVIAPVEGPIELPQSVKRAAAEICEASKDS